MILVKTNQKSFVRDLKQLGIQDIDHETSEYIIIHDKNAWVIIKLYYLNLQFNKSLEFIAIQCEQIDSLSQKAISFLEEQKKFGLYKLSQVIIMGFKENHVTFLNEMKQWYQSFDIIQREFSKTVIECEGIINDIALQYYMHRNTVRLKLDQFYFQTGYDLRLFEVQKIFELCSCA